MAALVLRSRRAGRFRHDDQRDDVMVLPMFGMQDSGSALDLTAHVIQVALTPVFLLSGIATLLNVFSTRLARVADRVDALSKEIEGADADEANALSAQLAYLHRRSLALDVAVVLGAVGGAATCAAVLALFVGALRNATIASVLFALFGLAVFCSLVHCFELAAVDRNNGTGEE